MIIPLLRRLIARLVAVTMCPIRILRLEALLGPRNIMTLFRPMGRLSLRSIPRVRTRLLTLTALLTELAGIIKGLIIKAWTRKAVISVTVTIVTYLKVFSNVERRDGITSIFCLVNMKCLELFVCTCVFGVQVALL